MEFTAQSFLLLPIGLGLLGFIEPCTVGGHVVFLDTQNSRSQVEKINAVLVFILARSVMTGLFGAFVAFAGQQLIGLQTGMWLIFGAVYLAIGIAYVVGRAGLVKRQTDFAPAAWKQAQNPLALGLAFGLNIPACAAPILFGLLGLAATTGTFASGFSMMFLFGLSLSLPLLLFALAPRLSARLELFAQKLKRMRWTLGIVFLLLGLWSIWFGLFVEPANWAGI